MHIQLPITVKLTFQYRVGDFLKSTLHWYIPVSLSLTPNKDKTAVGVDSALN